MVLKKNPRVKIFVICALETIWYTYVIGMSWYGIGQTYFDWILERKVKSLDWSEVEWFAWGIIIGLLSWWCTLALLYVAFTNGENPRLLYLYCIKNLANIVAGLFLFGRLIGQYRTGDVDVNHLVYPILLGLTIGLLVPLFFVLQVLHYHQWIMSRDDCASYIYHLYEEKMKAKRDLQRKKLKEAAKKQHSKLRKRHVPKMKKKMH